MISPDSVPMLAEKNLKSNQIKVVTDRRTAYLMGLVERPQANLATNVTRLVVAFDEELSERDGAAGIDSVLNPANWVLWVGGIATASRYLHAAGMLMGPSLDQVQPLRFVGALGTYLGGLALCVAVFMS